jgi:hypothetical protein
MEEFPIPIFHFFVHTKISCEKDLSNTKSVEASDFILSKMCFSQLINRGKCLALCAKHIISCEKDLSNTKSVEASDFVLSKINFSQLINEGKCFAHSDLM